MRPLFQRYIGVDYSGAATPQTGLCGLRIFMAERHGRQPPTPREVRNPLRASGHWSREALAHYLRDILQQPLPAVVAIDHGFSFPQAYFERHGLSANWHVFLDDFCRHWPTDAPGVRVRDVRQGTLGSAALRAGDSRWRRQTEQRCGAKSVFHFDVPGSVATSTHAGLPWLRWLLEEVPQLHCWPYDGWAVPAGHSLICEGYPALISAAYPQLHASQDAHDAYALCRWLAESDQQGLLGPLFAPGLSGAERSCAEMEGWIFGLS